MFEGGECHVILGCLTVTTHSNLCDQQLVSPDTMLQAKHTLSSSGRPCAQRRAGIRPFTPASIKCRAQEQPSLSTGGSWSLPISAAACITAAMLCSPSSALAREKIGEFQASGFLFKDTVEVNALDDPEVPGVTIYFSDFKRNLVDKLQKDFFSEPSQASLTCSISPDAVVLNPAAMGGLEGKEVLSEKKGISIFKDKTLRVRRVYDPTRQTLVYVAYSTRLSTAADEGSVSTGRYRTSICALKLPANATSPAVADAEAAVAPA